MAAQELDDTQVPMNDKVEIQRNHSRERGDVQVQYRIFPSKEPGATLTEPPSKELEEGEEAEEVVIPGVGGEFAFCSCCCCWYDWRCSCTIELGLLLELVAGPSLEPEPELEGEVGS